MADGRLAGLIARWAIGTRYRHGLTIEVEGRRYMLAREDEEDLHRLLVIRRRIRKSGDELKGDVVNLSTMVRRRLQGDLYRLHTHLLAARNLLHEDLTDEEAEATGETLEAVHVLMALLDRR